VAARFGRPDLQTDPQPTSFFRSSPQFNLKEDTIGGRMYPIDSAFGQYKVHADIRGGSVARGGLKRQCGG